MSRFVSQETTVIDLGEGESVTLRKSLSYTELEPVIGLATAGENNKADMLKISMPLLRACIVGWEMKDENGNAVAFDLAKISELDVNTVLELVQKAMTLYFPEKKTSLPSNESSSMTAEAKSTGTEE